jgi:hypothetical protein
MSFTIQLERPVEVNALRFQGVVGILEPQPWVVAVARLTAEFQGEISAEDVSRDLLGNRLPIAQGLIQQCLTLGLLDEDRLNGNLRYRLTEFGKRAAERGEVFMPHPGTWTIWFTEDETLDEKFLLLEPWREPSALDEVGRNRRVGANRNFIRAPRWLGELEGRELKLPMGDYTAVRILSILDQVEEAGDGNLSLKFHLVSHAAGSHTHLEGHVAQPKRKDTTPEPRLFESSARKIETNFDDCWQALLECEGLTETWDAQARSLRIPFPANEQERQTRLGERLFNHPSIPGLGYFNAARVRGVPLRPATAKDAHQWALWQLRTKVTTYATEKLFQQWSSETKALFPEWQPPFPTRAELAARLRPAGEAAPTQAFWKLQSPIDWNL